MGFVWQNGAMRQLPTLGGTNGFAAGTNDLGQTVGWAETNQHDTTCVAPQYLQFRAVEWGPSAGQIRELPPLAGDTATAATAINDRGQVVGISGICDIAIGRYTAIHAVIWQDGRPVSLGMFPGGAWNTPMAINDRGEVAGFANASAAAGGSLDPRAFSWTAQGGIRWLPMLPGDVTSSANGMNDAGDIVGSSCDALGACRAVVWHGGHVLDLNKLARTGSGQTLVSANDINDLGEITGQAQEPAGQLVAFSADPGR